MSKIFSEEISSVIAEERGLFTPQILYGMCDERLHDAVEFEQVFMARCACNQK